MKKHEKQRKCMSNAGTIMKRQYKNMKRQEQA